MSPTAAGLAAGLDVANASGVGHGFAELGAGGDLAGWRLWADAGLRQRWGTLYGEGWARRDAWGLGLGVRW